MKIELVNGTGKCIECGEMTSYQLWIGKMQFYFCKDCLKILTKYDNFSEDTEVIKNGHKH